MLLISNILENDLLSLSQLYYQLTGKETNVEKMQKNFMWMKSNSDYIVLGAKEDDLLVGSIMGFVCKDLVGDCKSFMIIENMVVSEKHRGKGIGKQLMNYIEDIAKQRDCYYIIFVSSSTRKEAHGFYETMGYDLDAVQGFKKYL